MIKFWKYRLLEADEGDGDGGQGVADAGEQQPAAGAGEGEQQQQQQQAQGDWPADWRAKLSPDGKHNKTLDRFASPNALMDSYLALRQKVDSGELRTVSAYPDKGTPEEQAAWRQSHGIPEKPEDYGLKFEDGLVIGDIDKPMVDDFLKAAHASHMPPEQVNGVLRWYYGMQDKAFSDLEQKDTEYLQQSEDTLRAEWGGEYRTNINMIKGLVSTLPESVREAFVNARLGDGTALLNNPEMARWLVHTARTINPTATVVPNAGGNLASAIEDEIATIEKTMRENRKAYNNDPKMQERLRTLYDARERAH